MAVKEILRRTPFAGGVPGCTAILAGSLLLRLLRAHPRPGRLRLRPAPTIVEADMKDTCRYWGSSHMSHMSLRCVYLVLHHVILA